MGTTVVELFEESQATASEFKRVHEFEHQLERAEHHMPFERDGRDELELEASRNAKQLQEGHAKVMETAVQVEVLRQQLGLAKGQFARLEERAIKAEEEVSLIKEELHQRLYGREAFKKQANAALWSRDAFANAFRDMRKEAFLEYKARVDAVKKKASEEQYDSCDDSESCEPSSLRHTRSAPEVETILFEGSSKGLPLPEVDAPRQPSLPKEDPSPTDSVQLQNFYLVVFPAFCVNCFFS